MIEQTSQYVANSQSVSAISLAEVLKRIEFPEHKNILFATAELDQRHFCTWLIQQLNSGSLSLKDLLNHYAVAVGPPSRAAVNRLFYADKVLTGWLDQLPLDPELLPIFRQWSGGLMAVMASDTRFSEHPEHTLRQLLSLVEQHSYGWFGGLDRSGRLWLEHLAEIGGFLRSSSVLDPVKQEAQWLATRQFIDTESSRVQILEKRLKESEIGADRAWYFHQLVHSTINRLFSQWLMPEAVAQFIAGPWRDSMLLLLQEEGGQGAGWQRQSKLAETLVWSMQESDDPAAKQKLYQVAVRLVDELAKGLLSFKHNPQEAEPWLDRIQQLVMARVKGESVERCPAFLLPLQTGFEERKETVTDQGYGLIGKWFLHRKTGVRQKCLAYLPNQENVVWVNYLGKKLGVQAWNAVKDELKQQVLVSFSAASGLDQAIQHTVAKFASIDALQEKQRQFALEREVARERLEDIARTQARQKAEAEIARIESERAEAARRYEQERQLAEQQARADQIEAEERQSLALLQSMREALDRLNLGGWLELIDGEERKRCKLAVRLNATDKLVFVDRLGLRIGDFKRDDIVDRLVAGTARILDEGTDFDQRLSRVVGSIRSDRR